MKLCMPGKKFRFLKWCGWIVLVFLIIVALFIAAAMIISREFPPTGVFFVLLFFMHLPNCIKAFRFNDRKYQITTEGIHTNDKGKNFYSWDEIHGIGIYPFDSGGSLQRCDKTICCFLAPPPEDIGKLLLRNKNLYAEMNQDKMLLIDFDESVYEELRSVYPGEIADCFTGTCPYGEWQILK